MINNYQIKEIPHLQLPAKYIMNDMNRNGTTYSVPYGTIYGQDEKLYMDYKYKPKSQWADIGGCTPQWLYNPYATTD